jgi:hypothetical protein
MILDAVGATFFDASLGAKLLTCNGQSTLAYLSQQADIESGFVDDSSELMFPVEQMSNLSQGSDGFFDDRAIVVHEILLAQDGAVATARITFKARE